MSEGRARLRHGLVTLGCLAAAWSITLVVTRGVSFDIGPVHLSSRNARNPAIVALLVLIAAVFLAPAGARVHSVGRDVSALLARVVAIIRGVRHLRPILELAVHPRVLRTLAAGVVLLTLALVWDRGSFVAGGADSYGYVSEAHLFATGRVRADAPLAGRFPHVPVTALTPFGYLPATDGSNTLVPMYSPGLPLTMAVMEVIGGANAVYLVMPLLGAVAVWGAYWIGARLVGPGVGLGAALLVAASPAFVFQLIGAPLSDICAAGWWTLSIGLLLHERRWSAAAAGVAAGLAILTRPNLLLVVVVLGLYQLLPAIRDVSNHREHRTRFARFSAPVIVACLTVAAFNTVWYGSPLRSGYAPDLFSAANWDDNIVRFSRWLTESQTPLFFLGFAAPLVAGWLPAPRGLQMRPVTMLLAGVVLAVFASYLFYRPFDDWWFLRFLLPAFPAIAVLTCITLAAVANRFGPPARVLAAGLVIAVAAFGFRQIAPMELLAEYRYRIMGEWVRDHLPDNAIVVSSQHAGSIRHYSGRSTVRYDAIARNDFESALNEIIDAGYHPYLVVDEEEIALVRGQHGEGARGAIDWPPIAVLPMSNVTVWDLAEDRDAARASGRTPHMIPPSPASVLPRRLRRD
jgi:hypothetical protein